MGSNAQESAHGIPQFDGGSRFQNWSYRVQMFLDSTGGVLKTLTYNLPAVESDSTMSTKHVAKPTPILLVAWPTRYWRLYAIRVPVMWKALKTLELLELELD